MIVIWEVRIFLVVLFLNKWFRILNRILEGENDILGVVIDFFFKIFICNVWINVYIKVFVFF